MLSALNKVSERLKDGVVLKRFGRGLGSWIEPETQKQIGQLTVLFHWKLSMLLIYCCITNHLILGDLKQPLFFFHKSVGQLGSSLGM